MKTGPQSGFDKSIHAREIRQMIAQAKKDKQPLTQVYKEIKELEPNVPGYQQFLSYCRKILAMIEEDPRNDAELLDRAIQKSIAIGDIVLEQTLSELKNLVDGGKVIPWDKKKELMKWFNDSGNMQLKKKFMDIKNKQGALSIAALSLLADAARYGKLKPQDINIIEGEITDAVISTTEELQPIEPGGEAADIGIA